MKNDAGDVPLCSCLENGCYGNRLKVGVSVCQFIALQQADYGAVECVWWEGKGERKKRSKITKGSHT